MVCICRIMLSEETNDDSKGQSLDTNQKKQKKTFKLREKNI